MSGRNVFTQKQIYIDNKRVRHRESETEVIKRRRNKQMRDIKTNKYKMREIVRRIRKIDRRRYSNK